MPEVKMYCPKHNLEYPARHKFCQVCGDPLIDKPRGASVRCPNCQAEIKEGMRFCQSCGSELIPNVKQGARQVKLSHEGYEDWTQNITLNFDWALNAELTRLPHDRRLEIARRHMRAGRTNGALALLEELAGEEPSGPGAYESMDEIYYDSNNLDRARLHVRQALEGGGRAEFTVTHDRKDGQTQGNHWKSYCRGRLVIAQGFVSFRSDEPSDSSTVHRSDIREVKLNRRLGCGIGAFNIKTTQRNYNLAPKPEIERGPALFLI